jgi:hypothetical protein
MADYSPRGGLSTAIEDETGEMGAKTGDCETCGLNYQAEEIRLLR